MSSEDDFHDQIAAHPETPAFYGRNLNALHDVLVGFYQSPVDVTWKDSHIAREALGRRFSLILDVFGDAGEDWHMQGGSLGVILEMPEEDS